MAAPPLRLPIRSWLGDYGRDALKGDLVAGLTTAVMLVPQAMAYAALAGLPPHVGLYASIAPLLAYAVLGTSRPLAVGPVAIDSMMVAAATARLADTHGQSPEGIAALLALLVGTFEIGAGLLRLGFLADLLSRPVISGFTSAAAIVIGASQLGPLLGVKLPRGTVFDTLGGLAGQLHAIHAPTLLLGLVSIAVLRGLKRWAPRIPAPLVVVVATTGLVGALGWDGSGGVAVVGSVPPGLPPLGLPALPPGLVRDLLVDAALIAVVGFLEAFSVATAFARRGGGAVVPDQELLALGAANAAAALTAGYPVTGGFSRTAVNAAAGARTPLAGVFTAAWVALTLLVLTPAFTHLPRATLAAIVLVAVLGLVDVSTPRRLWAVRRDDAGLLGLTFGATLVLGISGGIATGVLANTVVFLRRAMTPHCAELGRKEGPGDGEALWRNLCRHADAVPPQHAVVLRVDASLWFANARWLLQTAAERLNAAAAHGRAPIALVLDFSAVNDVDATALDALETLRADLEEAGRRLVLVRVKGPVHDVLARAGLVARLGDDALFETVDGAVDAVARETRAA